MDRQFMDSLQMILRDALTRPRTIADLKRITKIHDVSLTIALRNLHLNGEAVCGFVDSAGQWMDQEISCCDEGFFVAWFIPPSPKPCKCWIRTEDLRQKQ